MSTTDTTSRASDSPRADLPSAAGRPVASARGRKLLWSGAGVAIAVLLYLGFVYPSSVKADAGTRIGIANVHLSFAQSLPTGGAQASQPRLDAIQKAESILSEVETDYPGLSITSEFRAFASCLRGDTKLARDFYREALSRESEDRSVRARIMSNLASLELDDGRPDDALRQLDEIGDEFATAAVWVARARAWNAKGASDKRAEQLEAGFRSARDTGDEKEIFVVSEAAAELGDGIARTAFQYLSETSYRARYRLAMLKIDSGDTDRATSMLTEVARKAPRDFQLWIRTDREYWGKGDRKAIADKVLAASALPSR